MVAATYGNYHFEGSNKALSNVEKSLPSEVRMEYINESTSLSALIRGRLVGITGRRPAGMRNRAEFEAFVNQHGGVFDNNMNHWDKFTLVIGDVDSPSAKMNRAKAVGSIIVPADRL